MRLTHARLGIVARRAVLELGSGAGFLGIIVAAIQNRCDTGNAPGEEQSTASTPASVLHLTDANSEVLERCRQNIYLPCSESIALS